MYAFDYQRPGSVNDVKAAFSGDARYLAGGQSLIQAMKLRLSSSERLVDLGGIAELKTIKIDGANLVIGAMCTHAQVAMSADDATAACVTIAPITRFAPSMRIVFSSAIAPRSTSVSLCDRRSFIAWIRLCPPAR